MSSIPRIVVVDPRSDIARIVRGAMALLSRQHILLEVPSAAAALDEIERFVPDLVVTAYALPDGWNGAELAEQINRGSLDTAVIVLAAEDDIFDRAQLQQGPFQFFVRPVAEPFLRGMRIALNGFPAAAYESPAEVELPELGTVPRVDLGALRDVMVPLMRDVGAMGVVLADRTGRVLIDEGATGYIDRERLAALLGPSFERGGDVGALVGGRAWAMQYYDGDRIDLFALSLGLHYFMCLLFEGSNRSAMGAVAVYGRRAADRMVALMGDAAFAVPEPPALAVPEVSTSQGQPVPDAAESQPPAGEADEAMLLEPLPDGAFDPESLFGQEIDEDLAASMFDSEALSDLVDLFAADDDRRLDFDEARNQGLIDD